MSSAFPVPPPTASIATNWYKVAAVEELADGELKRVPVAGKVLVLVRVGDRYGALDNRCPHMGGPLAEGSLENGRLVCPWHGREYDPLNGNCDGYAESVRAYPVEVRADGVYAAL
ncbi:MAG: Rieske (2Fe-2S) protein [Betaproteobacteria bacterium]